ncbi:hypothetical protein RF11_16015 [Thelohanellus kitauei]|uniref:Uncharacterized protein n=1 Tax=Thelohanellus kitauei TaxID=669202 RepID=A0A0C2MHE5_THEKT|nr:hypothetical protein RF11_16015 [Thelohanellus kitauei]
MFTAHQTSSAQSIQPLIDQLKQTDTKAQQIMSRIAEIMREIDQKTELSRNIQAQNLALEHDIDDLTSKLLKITALQNQIDHLTSVNNQLLIETQNLRGSHEFGDLSNFDVDREMETKSRLLQDLEKSLKHVKSLYERMMKKFVP